MKDNTYESLKNMVDFLVSNSKVHICVHDITGILLEGLLELDFYYKRHKSIFCETAKSTPRGLQLCLACKYLANNKAKSTKEYYCGVCPLGLTEISLPVWYKGNLVCVVYVGNLIVDKNQTIKKIKISSQITGVDSEKLISLLSKSEHVTDLNYYIKMAYILKSYILLLCDQINFSFKPESHWIVESMKDYVGTYYGNDLKLTTLAKLYYMNEKYIGRLFKKETGISFSQYINLIRIKRAKEFLESTNLNIIEIAMRVGFVNVTYFNRVFKAFEGITPKEYRNK